MKIERTEDEVVLTLTRGEYSTLMFLVGAGSANGKGNIEEFAKKLYALNYSIFSSSRPSSPPSPPAAPPAGDPPETS